MAAILLILSILSLSIPLKTAFFVFYFSIQLSMNRFFYALVLCTGLFSPSLGAQDPDYSTFNQVIGSTGQMLTREGLTWAYTIGEVTVATYVNADLKLTLTQGFHQPETSRTVQVRPDVLLSAWAVEVFPNPTATALTVRFERPRLRAIVTDALGRICMDERLLQQSQATTIDCTGWQPGVYFLHLSDPAAVTIRGTIRFVVVGL
jgi:Secretion system C-terminal sorting domain